MMKRRRLAACIGLAALVSGCGGLRSFPLRDPMWVDQDKRPFTEEPDEYFSSFFWDGADQMMFRPFAKFWKVDPAGEAVNVNAMDEVPDSSWFTNRIGRFPMTPAQVAKGPCTEAPLDPNTTWTVTGAKPNGANPGFPIKAADGRRYMVKFDGIVQGPRATAADTVVSKFYYAAGYNVPCNQIVHFDRSILKIDPDAKSEDATGQKIPLTEKDLDKVFSKSIRLPDGRYRASASLFLKGKPIGPFRYEGTRSDDPNDVIAHEDRRELRANYIIAAWTNHFDAREQNSLDMFVEEKKGQGGYVHHSMLDFGDCFGSVWEPPDLGRRIGHSHYFAADHIAGDFITFGLVKRPWDDNRFGKAGKALGYYKVDDFVPDGWRPGYPNPAMLRMSERDGAWMARILARMTPAHIVAMLGEAKITDQELLDELTRIVLGRRRKLLARYLSGVSPLTDPEVVVHGGSAELCMDDLAVTAGVFPRSTRRYQVRAYLTTALERAAVPKLRIVDRVCAPLPAVPGSGPDDPKYMVVDMFGRTGSQQWVPARVHLYHSGGSDYRVVGLERPSEPTPPG
jgi:hypothetical protein